MTPERMSTATRGVLDDRAMRKFILPELDFFLKDEPIQLSLHQDVGRGTKGST